MEDWNLNFINTYKYSINIVYLITVEKVINITYKYITFSTRLKKLSLVEKEYVYIYT